MYLMAMIRPDITFSVNQVEAYVSDPGGWWWKKIKPVLDKFGDHFEPLKSKVFERFKFLRGHQLPGESFDSCIVCLRGMTKVVIMARQLSQYYVIKWC
jgi:hypothetical protein